MSRGLHRYPRAGGGAADPRAQVGGGGTRSARAVPRPSEPGVGTRGTGAPGRGCPRRSYLPTKFSSTELLPALWPPTTAICGRSRSAFWPMAEKASCNRLTSGMRSSMPRLPMVAAGPAGCDPGRRSCSGSWPPASRLQPNIPTACAAGPPPLRDPSGALLQAAARWRVGVRGLVSMRRRSAGCHGCCSFLLLRLSGRLTCVSGTDAAQKIICSVMARGANSRNGLVYGDHDHFISAVISSGETEALEGRSGTPMLQSADQSQP